MVVFSLDSGFGCFRTCCGNFIDHFIPNVCTEFLKSVNICEDMGKSMMSHFLPRDASAERGYEIECRLSVRLSVCLSVCNVSVTFRYRVQIGFNSSKVI